MGFPRIKLCERQKTHWATLGNTAGVNTHHSALSWRFSDSQTASINEAQGKLFTDQIQYIAEWKKKRLMVRMVSVS